MKIAIIGQSLFGADVYKILRQNGHEIVGVFTVPDDAKGRPDPLGKPYVLPLVGHGLMVCITDITKTVSNKL